MRSESAIRRASRGGPPSTNLNRQIGSARSAIVVAYPIDEAAIDLYMGEIDHYPYKMDMVRANNLVDGLLADMVTTLRALGYKAENVNPANTIGGGQKLSDIIPHTERQKRVAELPPATEVDHAIGALALIS
jgi:hypothetical protein